MCSTHLRQQSKHRNCVSTLSSVQDEPDKAIARYDVLIADASNVCQIIRAYLFSNSLWVWFFSNYVGLLFIIDWISRRLHLMVCAVKISGQVQGYGRPHNGSGGGAPRTPENFRNFAKIFLKKIAKCILLPIYQNNWKPCVKFSLNWTKNNYLFGEILS